MWTLTLSRCSDMCNCDNSQTTSATCGQQPEQPVDKTVDEVFQAQIEQARKFVEELCVKRAKLEALNMHKMPYNEVRNLLDTY